MDILDLIIRELENTDYDGLYNEDGECGCILGDLAPCGEMPNSCIFGYKIEADSNSDFDWFVVAERTKREVRNDE